MDEWEEIFSEAKQKPYWKNKATGEKTWKNPKGSSNAAKEAPPTEATDATASDEWEELFSETKNKKYWKNKKTGEKTWKPPPSVTVTDAPKVAEVEKTESNPIAEGGNITATESDWVELFSTAKGKPYWKNNKTGEKSWHPPNKTKSQDAADDAKSVVSAPTSVDQSLTAPAHGWVELFSEKKGKKYWKNKLTGESTWKMPPELANAPPKPAEEAPPAGGAISKTGSFTSVVSALTNAEVAAAAASNWTEHFSEKKGKKYWKNKATGESTWKMPPELANPPQVETKVSAPTPNPVAPAPAAAVESDWVEKFSESKGKKYWKNKITGETTWKPPAPTASAPPTISIPAIAEEKVAEIAAPTVIKAAEVIVDKRSVVFRSVARCPTNPTGLYLFELIGPVATTQLILHEITQEAHFQANCESLLSSPTPLKLDGAIEESRRFSVASIQKIICNKEVGSLLLVLPKSTVASTSTVHEMTSAEETKSGPINEERVEELFVYFHSALLCEQIYYLIHYCCYQCSPPSPFLPLDLSNYTENHRLLMKSKIGDLFVNASYLTSIPERYIQLEMILAKYNRLFYQDLLFIDRLSSSLPSSLTAPYAISPLSIRYIPSLPAGQKDIEVTLHQIFPLAGMIVLKVHLHLPSNDSSDNFQTSIQQMKSGAWMPCWIQIDYHQKSITFFERGPTQPSTFKIYCSFYPTTLLRIHDLTDVQDELKIEIMDAVLAENNHPNDNNDKELGFINISFLFKNVQDLWRWTLSFSAICSMIQWKNSTSNHEFTQPIKLSRYHHTLTLSPPPTVASSSSGLTATQQIPVRAVVTDGNVLLGLESAIVDRDIIHQLIRYVSLPGYLIHQQFKFFNQQQRILMTSKPQSKSTATPNSSERIKGITDGSLLLSINGLSAVQLPGNTVIKFINDIPDEMITDMAFIKFSPTDFIVNAVEIDHTGFVHHQFFTGSENSPSSATNLHTHLDTSPLSSRGGGIGKKLDVESKNQLHRVLEKKRNFAMQQTHSDPDDTRTMEEKLLAVHLGSHSVDPANNSQPAKKRKENLLTLQQFHLTNFEEISWTRYRLSITNGKIIISSVHPTPSMNGLLNGFGEIFYRFSLNQMQLKVIIHQNKDSNDLVSLQEIGLEIYDSNSHIILHCMNFKKFRALLHQLLLGMKLYGALPLDLPYIYSQSEKWKMIKQQCEIGVSMQASSTTTSAVLAKQKLMLEGGDMLLSEDMEENQHKDRLRKAASKYATSGILQQTVLLANLEEEGGETGKADSEEDEINGRAHRGGKDESHHRRESVIMSISSVLEDYSDEHRSRSLLQAAESLEETLSSLELPLVFPTPTVIEQNLQELRGMNKANHQLMAELMTLQLDVISPIDSLNGVGMVAAGGPSQQQNNPNQGLPGVANKNPYQGYGETQTVEDQYAGDSTLEDNDIESIVENVNNIDDNLFSTNEPPHPPVMSGPIPPPPSGSGTPQQGQLPRRSSFITGNPIDISQQKPNAPKLTRRASRLSVSIDLSNTNVLNTSSPAILPPQQSKPVPTKTFSLLSDDQLALKILFLHLRENPADLISTAAKIISVPDLAVYAYIVVNRVYCQFSSDSLRLCDLIDAAMKYENPILNQSGSSKPSLITSPTMINPLVAASTGLGGNNQPVLYLDDFATAASLMSSAVSRAAGIGVSTINNNANMTNFNPLTNGSSTSSTQQQNYHYLYFNEFVQYFSYSIKPATSISSALSPSPFQSPFKSTNNTQAGSFNKPSSPSIHSNTLLLLILYEVAQRLDIMTFVETLCQDIQLSQIHFPSNAMMTSANGSQYPQSLPPVNSLNFTVPIQEICQFIMDPLIQRLEMLLNENQVPTILLLMMKKLSLHYHYDVHYLEYLYAMIIQFVLHKIMIFYRSHYDENNPIQVANHLNQQIQQMNYMSYMMSQQGGGSGSVGYPNSPAYMMMNNYATNSSTSSGASSNPMLFMQEEQLIYMIQYIKQVLLLCFQSACASSSIGTAASANAQSIAAGGSGASAIMGANNTIQINQKIVTLSLSDVAVLSKSKWLLSRCLERFVHTIEDLTRQNIHNYGAPSTMHNTNTVNANNGGNNNFHRSPLASLSYLHQTTGKSKIIEGYLCMRPSELLFLLQLFDFYNLTSSSLIISSSSRQLSQAITILQTTDIIGRLSYYTLSLPTSTATTTATSNTLLGSSTRRTYQRLSIDREVTIVLEVDPSIPLGKFETISSSGVAGIAPLSTQAAGLGHGGFGQSKSWADLLFEKHGGGGNLTSVHSESMDSTVHTIIPSNHANQSTHEVTALLDDNNASLFLFPEATGGAGVGDSVLFSSNSSELQSIQWLINTARITLQYIYENISNLSLQKSKSIIKELTDIHQKLQEKKKIIQILLNDYQRLLLNKDYLFHEKLLLQVNYDLLQYNIQIHGQTMRAQRSAVTNNNAAASNVNNSSSNPPKRSGSVVLNPMNMVIPTMTAVPGVTQASSASSGGHTAGGLVSSTNYYYDIYYSPLQFILSRMLSHLIYQDYYQGKFHFYQEEEKEVMIQQFILKTIHLEKQLSTVAFAFAPSSSSTTYPSTQQNATGEIVFGQNSGGGLLSRRVQQQKVAFGSSSVHHAAETTNLSSSANTANAGILPMTGGMNPLRVIMQNVFNSSSSAQSRGNNQLPSSPIVSSPQHNNQTPTSLYPRRIHY